MGFAEKWADVEAQPLAETHRDNMDRMDTIAPVQVQTPYSVHCVHSVHKGSTLTPAPMPAPDASPLVALARFERNPHGVVEWLASQNQGQAQYLVPRWAACVRAEARLRIAAAEAGAGHGC